MEGGSGSQFPPPCRPAQVSKRLRETESEGKMGGESSGTSYWLPLQIRHAFAREGKLQQELLSMVRWELDGACVRCAVSVKTCPVASEKSCM